MTQQQSQSTSIFSLAPNHQELLMPTSIQGNNPLVNVAIRFWGVKGVPTPQRTVYIDGVKHSLYVGSFLGTELVETISSNGKEGQRYAPLRSSLTSGDFLPPELHKYIGDAIPVPNGTNISFLLSDENLEVLKEFSQESNSFSPNGYQGKTKNAWVIKVEMHLYQAMTILAITDRDKDNQPLDTYHISPSILITTPIELVPNVNLTQYSQFEGAAYPVSKLTSEEVAHPLTSFLINLVGVNQEYGTLQSIFNGSRAYTPGRRNENLPAVSERTVAPTPPSNFMDDTEEEGDVFSGTTTTSKPPRTLVTLQ